MSLFRLLGVVLAVYTVWSAWRGAVYVRSGVWGRTIRREAAPTYFWTVIAIYGLLALALATVFDSGMGAGATCPMVASPPA